MTGSFLSTDIGTRTLSVPPASLPGNLGCLSTDGGAMGL